MALKSANVSPPHNRPRKKSALKWPLYTGGLLGLLVVSFLVGMYGIPRTASTSNAGGDLIPTVEPVAPAEGDSRVRVTELPEERSRRIRMEADSTARSEEKKRPAASPSEEKPTPAPPSPPAVSSAQQESTAAPASTGSATEAPPVEEVSSSEEIAPAPPSSFRVQAGAFQDEETARRMADRVASAGYQPSVTTSKDSDGTMYHVQVGPFPEKAAAEDAVRELGQQGISARVAE